MTTGGWERVGSGSSRRPAPACTTPCPSPSPPGHPPPPGRQPASLLSPAPPVRPWFCASVGMGAAAGAAVGAAGTCSGPPPGFRGAILLRRGERLPRLARARALGSLPPPPTLTSELGISRWGRPESDGKKERDRPLGGLFVCVCGPWGGPRWRGGPGPAGYDGGGGGGSWGLIRRPAGVPGVGAGPPSVVLGGGIPRVVFPAARPCLRLSPPSRPHLFSRVRPVFASPPWRGPSLGPAGLPAWGRAAACSSGWLGVRSVPRLSRGPCRHACLPPFLLLVRFRLAAPSFPPPLLRAGCRCWAEAVGPGAPVRAVGGSRSSAPSL